jgi:type II secretory pathway pseudopilin PulG
MTGGRRAEAGFALVALMATVAVMLIMMAAAVPSWRYVMKDDREQELIFRGGEIADAIVRYQRKNGNALPPSFEVLVKGRYLRREYKDPMTKSGKWRILHPGESVGPIRAPGAEGAASSAGRSTGTTTSPSGTTRSATSRSATPGGTTVGAIQGVASTSTDKSLRVFNGRTHYNEWVFLPGQPRVVGRPMGPTAAPGLVAPGTSTRPTVPR